MAYEELFADLLKAEREEDVTDALMVFGLEKFSDSNWLPYGGIENNYGIIGAQQADAIGALVEKVVNSIDAILMRECFARWPKKWLAPTMTAVMPAARTA